MDTNPGLGFPNIEIPEALAADRVIDIGVQIDAGAWGGFQKLVLVYAALAFTVDGLANLVLGLAIPALMRDWHLAKHDFAPVLGLGLIGVGFGAALGGIFGDRYGRRLGLIGSIIIFGAVTTASAFVSDIGQLTLLRLLAGIGLGSTIPNAASLVAEFTPARRRSMAIGLAMVFIPVGSLISGVIAAAILPNFGWRVFFGIGGVIPLVLAVVLFFLVPESPRFLIRRPARRATLVTLMRRMGHQFGDGTELVDHRHTGAKTSLTALFGRSNWRDTLALWGAFFACLLALYTFFSWGPEMLAGEGFSLAASSAALAAFNFGGIAGTLACTWLTYRFGSKLTILGSCLVGIAILVCLGVFPLKPAASILPLLFAFGGVSFCIGSFQNVIYPLAAHIYPPFTKATGVGAASAAGRLGAVLSAFTGLISMQWRGESGYFLVLAAALAIGLLCSISLKNHIAPREKVRPAG